MAGVPDMRAPAGVAPADARGARASQRVAGAYLTSSDVPPEVRHTILGDAREIVEELRHSGDLIRQLTLRDIRVRYKQAVFGFAWAILIPAAVVLAGMAVRVAVAYAAGKHIDMTQLAGMAVKAVPWAFFVGCLSTGTSSLVSNTSLVTKIYFPREVLPLSSVLAQTFDSLIGGTLIALVLPFFGVRLSVQLLWVPILLLLLWSFALAAALFLSRANLFFRDVKYMVQVFLTFGIFVTPVILDAPMFGERMARSLMLNPIAPLLEGLRLAVVSQHNLLQPFPAPAGWLFWHPWYLAYSAVWALGGLAASTLLFHRSERHFAEAV
jgi:lipopolysaccharide transport system permease protein